MEVADGAGSALCGCRSEFVGAGAFAQLATVMRAEVTTYRNMSTYGTRFQLAERHGPRYELLRTVVIGAVSAAMIRLDVEDRCLKEVIG